MKKAIVLGASSGIGKELAKVLSREGYVVGLVARRIHLLEELAWELPNESLSRRIDLSDLPESINAFEGLLSEMGGVDLVVVNAGTGFINPELDWEKVKATIDLNVSGFAAIANVAFQHFVERGSGHLVGISSIAALLGNGKAPAYNASKAFVSIYLDGLRKRAVGLRVPITVTDIQPGFVDTDMVKGEGVFWVASPEKAAHQIYRAIRKKRMHSYITKRWRLVAWSLKILPGSILGKFA